MSYFSTELRRLLQESGLSQNVVARRARVGQGTLSRYLSDSMAPDWKKVENVANAFRDPGVKARLLAAHARDVVHPSLRHKIGSSENGDAAPQHKWQDPRKRMPRELLAAYDGLGDEAIEQKRVADLLINMWRVVSAREK